MPWTMLQQFTDATASLALIAVFYGWIARHSATPLRQQVTLGLTFGIGAAYMMADPIIAAPGVVVDLRAVPVALAAAYLGPVGGLIAMAIAGLARTAIGGGWSAFRPDRAGPDLPRRSALAPGCRARAHAAVCGTEHPGSWRVGRRVRRFGAAP